MASHAPSRLRPRVDPLSAVLATIPSLPRPVLARLTARMIERLDEMDGDPDVEPDDEDTAIDDGPCDPDADRKSGSWAEDPCQHGTAHTYGDDECEDDAPEVRRLHCRRIRDTSCERFTRYGLSTYRLIGPAAEVMGLVPKTRGALINGKSTYSPLTRGLLHRTKRLPFRHPLLKPHGSAAMCAGPSFWRR